MAGKFTQEQVVLVFLFFFIGWGVTHWFFAGRTDVDALAARNLSALQDERLAKPETTTSLADSDFSVHPPRQDVTTEVMGPSIVAEPNSDIIPQRNPIDQTANDRESPHEDPVAASFRRLVKAVHSLSD